MEKAMSNGDEWEIDVCLVNNEGNVWSVQSPDYPFKCKYAPIWSLVYCKCTLTKVEGGSRSGWWRVVIRSELKMRNKGKSRKVATLSFLETECFWFTWELRHFCHIFSRGTWQDIAHESKYQKVLKHWYNCPVLSSVLTSTNRCPYILLSLLQIQLEVLNNRLTIHCKLKEKR